MKLIIDIMLWKNCAKDYIVESGDSIFRVRASDEDILKEKTVWWEFGPIL